MKVLVADDEPVVREGLKTIVDWESLGFEVCGEAANGTECLEKMLRLSPELVLLDIKMPGRLHGLDVAEQAKMQGFDGRIIIISGYSDFRYAQSAIRFGVSHYLLKPVDEEELENAVKDIRQAIETERKSIAHTHQYIDKAHDMLVAEILEGKTTYPEELLKAGDRNWLSAFPEGQYRVVIAESDDGSGGELLSHILMASCLDKQKTEALTLHGRSVWILKGERMIREAEERLHAINRDSAQYRRQGIFAANGRIVNDPAELSLSYQDALGLLEKRFFYPPDICFVTSLDVTPKGAPLDYVKEIEIGQYVEKMLSYIDSCNRDKAEQFIHHVAEQLRQRDGSVEEIKSLLTSFLIQLKHAVLQNYRQLQTSFVSDTGLIASVRSTTRLYEIEELFLEQVMAVIDAISNTSREHVIDNIVHYINKNYHKSLKLETLAELFGYNKAYLGKVLKSNLGEYFNSYLDGVRIANAKRMLRSNDCKVYEISERIGYGNIDYFYKKFKKYAGETPSEYRKRFCPAQENPDETDEHA